MWHLYPRFAFATPPAKLPFPVASIMSRDKKNPPPVDNVISEQTGQFDLRFILWRHFCKENSIPVDTLPSQLTEQQKESWEELKASRLRGQK
jgi:hypothetical protein